MADSAHQSTGGQARVRNAPVDWDVRSVRLARCLEKIHSLERAVACAAFLILAGVLFADVLSREFLGTGFAWARQLGVYANLAVTLAGLGLASAGAAHLRPRFADRWAPLSWAPILDRAQDAVTAIFMILFSVGAVLAVSDTLALDERTATPAWAVWPFQALLPVAFLVAAFRHAAYAIVPELRPTAGNAASGSG
jgi:TRAP-type C4-dicarboxylate transport system permease small subunit